MEKAHKPQVNFLTLSAKAKHPFALAGRPRLPYAGGIAAQTMTERVSPRKASSSPVPDSSGVDEAACSEKTAAERTGRSTREFLHQTSRFCDSESKRAIVVAVPVAAAAVFAQRAGAVVPVNAPLGPARQQKALSGRGRQNGTVRTVPHRRTSPHR